MRKIGSSVCLILNLAGVGSVHKTVPSARTQLDPSPNRSAKRPELRAHLNQAYYLVAAGRYVQATQIYERACPEADALGQAEWAGRCWNNLGSSYFSMFRYREALSAFLEARRISRTSGDWANLANLGSNISSLFLNLGELDAAVDAAEQGLGALSHKEFPGSRARFLIQLGVIRARQGRINESAALIGQAIDIAYRDGNLAVVAEAWDHLGEEYLARNALPDSDQALTEAFRIRTLHHLSKLDSSYWNVGRLRLAEGDLNSASALLDTVISRQAHPDSLTNVWSLYHARGQVRLAQDQVADAFADFAKALDLAREWRLQVIPADFTRISSEASLQEIYSSFVEAGNRLYFSTRREQLARATFRAAEENRAASLHALLREPNDWRDALPPEYWETLTQLHDAEVALLDRESPQLQVKMRRLRAALLVFEAKAGSNGDLADDELMGRTQKNLPADAALLSFHLSDGESYLWALDRERFRVYRLPGKADLAADAARFSNAVWTGSASAASTGQALYEELFGELEASFRDKPQWMLALDEQLFRIPFGALVIGASEAGPVYLAERHAICVTTGAVMLAARHAQPWSAALSGTFLGVGDAIYNTADPRWRSQSGERPSFLPWVAFAAPTPQIRGPVLARLPGTAREVESCARAWNPRPSAAILLEGPDASLARMRDALRGRPSVVHIAAHFLQAVAPPRNSMIALSLAGSDTQLLSPLEITRSKIDAGLVVLSGCSSGRADALPASGLMGLTRAWLAAGSRAVVASHWPTPDDSGALFVNFYRHLHETPDAGPAAALQGAQLDTLRAGGWRSNPQYWATYFVVGDR
jgi:CHAT domain-containing protein